jgi:hypothetical protein
MVHKRWMITICLLVFCFPTISVKAQNVHGTCVGEVLQNGQMGSCNGNGDTSSPSGNASAMNSAVGDASYQAGYAIGSAFMNWLLSPNTNADAAQQQQQLQRQQMMEEIRRRQQEAERLHQEAEANRLAAMYNRLASTLKLSGLPQLQLKTSGTASGGLQLKLGDSAQASTIPGLPGSNVSFDQHLSDLSSPSGLQLKVGDAGSASATSTPGAASGSPGAMDFSKMTPQQLADIADAISKLPPEQQQSLAAAAQGPGQQPPQVMRDFQQTLDGKSDLARVGSSSAMPNAGNQNSSATPATADAPGAAQPSDQPQVMRDFQQTLDGKSDLTRVGSSSAMPNAGNQNSSATPATANASDGGQMNGQPQGATVTPSTGQNVQSGNASPPRLPAQQVAAPSSATQKVSFDQGGSGQTSSGPAVEGLQFKLSGQMPSVPAPPAGQVQPSVPMAPAASTAPKGAVNAGQAEANASEAAQAEADDRANAEADNAAAEARDQAEAENAAAEARDQAEADNAAAKAKTPTAASQAPAQQPQPNLQTAAQAGVATSAAAQQTPPLATLPANLAASHPDLVARRAALVQERATLHDKIDSLNDRCGAVQEGSVAEAPCHSDQAAVRAALNSYIQRSKDFNSAVQALNRRAP